MGQEFQSYLTTPQQVAKLLLNATFISSIPTEGQAQFDDFFSYTDEEIPLISEELTKRCGGISFVPYLDTKKRYFSFMAESSFVTPTRLGFAYFLRDFLLEVDEITFGGTALVEDTDFILMPGDYYPYHFIHFKKSVIDSLSGEFGDNLSINGWWGYHKSSSQLYQAVAADATVTITDSATDLTVAATTAYERWQYLRIEDELLLISDRPDATSLTVSRGENGTTAAAHSTKPVSIVKPMRDIQSLAAAITAHNYKNRNLTTDTIQVGNIGIEIPKLMPRFTSTIATYMELHDGLFAGSM